MAWIEPVTNRVAGSRTTYEDLNRICNNLLEKGFELTKSVYFEGDFVTDSEWSDIVRFAKRGDSTVTNSTLYSNLNKLEAAIINAEPYTETIYWNFASGGTLKFSSSQMSGPGGSFAGNRKFESTSDVPWSSMSSLARYIDIESQIKPLYLDHWFDSMRVTSFSNFNRMDTSCTRSCENTFQGCRMTSIDVSSFDTSKVTNMENMFGSCNSLTTIYASSDFVVSQVTDSAGMFGGCLSLIGGNGTPFSSSHTNKEYARIDTQDTPGYFTQAV